MTTTLHLVGALTDRLRSWASVLEEEGYCVALPGSAVTAPAYAVVTIALDDVAPLAALLSAAPHPPVLAIHYAPRSLHACQLVDGATHPVVVHLAEDQPDVEAALAALPAPLVSLPPSSDDDDVAESPMAATGKLVRVHRYAHTQRDRAGTWATSLPFASQTATHAFDGDVDEWERSAAGMSYTRNIEAIKAHLGPCYDLERLWERHTRYEFQARDAAKTMATMIPQPYVNHVSCMTGGTGYDELLNFYTHNFVTRSPPDTELVPISRTIGADRVVDEMVFRCTHTCEVDYFLPSVAPTGKRLEIFMVAIVNFRGPKLAFESLYWDQASALVQLGLLDPKGLPCAGAAVGRKVLDPYRQPSNELFGQEARNRAAGFS